KTKPFSISYLSSAFQLNRIKWYRMRSFYTSRKKNMPECIPKTGQVDYANIRYAPVVNCVVHREGKILMIQRSAEMDLHPHHWNGISGFLDDEKTIEEKVLEELQEEGGIPSDHAVHILWVRRCIRTTSVSMWYTNLCVMENGGCVPRKGFMVVLKRQRDNSRVSHLSPRNKEKRKNPV
ncbi:NUDIX hydrolase, partial [bacterium]|nr:NUDIX hydrolase [bacterium]